MKPGNFERELTRLRDLARKARNQLDGATALVRESRSLLDEKETLTKESRDGTSENMPAQVEAVVK